MRRRGFLSLLGIAPIVGRLAPRDVVLYEPTPPSPIERAAMRLDGGVARLSRHLRLPVVTVNEVLFGWMVFEGFRDGVRYERYVYNNTQIVRTPAMWTCCEEHSLDTKKWALREHIRSIEYLLEHGKRYQTSNGVLERTFTGGRRFFGATHPGRVAALKGRALGWRWEESGGEWLSDIGWMA